MREMIMWKYRNREPRKPRISQLTALFVSSFLFVFAMHLFVKRADVGSRIVCPAYQMQSKREYIVCRSTIEWPVDGL